MFIGSLNIRNDFQSKFKYISKQRNAYVHTCSPQSFGIHAYSQNHIKIT